MAPVSVTSRVFYRRVFAGNKALPLPWPCGGTSRSASPLPNRPSVCAPNSERRHAKRQKPRPRKRRIRLAEAFRFTRKLCADFAAVLNLAVRGVTLTERCNSMWRSLGRFRGDHRLGISHSRELNLSSHSAGGPNYGQTFHLQESWGRDKKLEVLVTGYSHAIRHLAYLEAS